MSHFVVNTLVINHFFHGHDRDAVMVTMGPQLWQGHSYGHQATIMAGSITMLA